ncbi:MAG: V-type ATP synthase subunit I [Candidatus Margulisbacteria bacterium]|nr:V-type ATP synthase subunit I [Candidatus Margulisiibacteriota bacterium]MBU1616221.1 V-type ATP synthase subunit I [Candidatus Margulisiibacteriota bacterium]
MSLIKMRKLAIIGHQDSRAALLNFLQEAGVIQVTPLALGQPLNSASENYELFLTEIKAAIGVLDAAAGVKKSFIESFAPYKETIKQEVLAQTARKFDWRQVIAEINKIENELANLKNLEGKLLADLQLLRPFSGVKAPLNSLNSRGNLMIIAGSCRTKALIKFQTAFAARIKAGELVIAGQTTEKTFLFVVTITAEAAATALLLDDHNFEKISLPISKLTPAEEADQIEALLKKIETDRLTFRSELASLVRHKKQLTYIYDHYLQKNNERSARERLAYTEKAFILTGWLPQEKLDKLKSDLEKLDPALAAQEIEPDKGEQPPSMIENPGIFQPFELITKIFGPPSTTDMDPTAPLSFFFILFFALCLSDVGYGILLAVAAIYYKKTLTLSEGGKNLLNLLLWGGIATVFAGIITGSYFAIDLNTLPVHLSGPLKKLQLIDPVKNPLNMLIISLIIGIVQIITGLALGLYWKIRNGEYLEGIFDYGLWIFFLLALVLYGTTTALGHSTSLLFSRLSIGGAIALVLTQGRKESGLIKKGIFGILSLYRTTSFLGDTLSYSRILALMMTTSIIGMVINIIADLTKGSVPLLGYLIMAVVLIIGHIFNLVISVLGAFVHSARLQLVEYFGKFYEGGGKLFKPFRRETVYTIIETK